MQGSLHQIGLKDLQKHFPNPISDNLSDDFYISEIESGEARPLLEAPCRFDGYMATFCLSGSISIEVDLKKYRIRENTILFTIPGNIVRVSKEQAGEGGHFVTIAVSQDFLSSFRLDFSRLLKESLDILHNPCFSIRPDEREVFNGYFGLISSLIAANPKDLKEILRNIVSSALYYAGSVWSMRLGETPRIEAETGSTPRSKLVFESFIRLVMEYHDRERGMAFYADRLCLSPKYLSKLIREVSGKSGPEWIDSFVILEAKNMLKNSEMPVKEIVYRLHFSNSSVFYKYFKSHTGLTPSAYRGQPSDN